MLYTERGVPALVLRSLQAALRNGCFTWLNTGTAYNIRLCFYTCYA